jgi:phenylalanyl-tRNA synthetase beta chain
MNISYNWLKDLIEVNLPPPELAQKLTDAGSAVEGIHAVGDDYIFDFDLTSNRSDCLSHLGIAREISVVVPDSRFQIPDSKAEDRRPNSEDQNLVTIEDADLCHRFTARVIRGVKIGASPEWLVKRLEAVGERSINNVADITNYVMHELGNPMHSFDFNKLAGNRIVVRRARRGETIKTLDEVERTPDETMLMICDAEKPVAVGGIMGGFDSSITEATTDVLLEVAYFQRDSIRQTSRRLKLSTEASHRFERGVDIENLIRASNRATELICELAGGEAGEFVDAYPTKLTPNEIESGDIQFAVKRLTGLEVEEAEILRILNSLGIRTKEQSQIANRKSQIFVSPSWRHDIAIEEDLVEEVARIVGYDKIAEELPPAFGAGEYQSNEMRKFHLRQTLANIGFDEAISYSFIDSKTDETFALVPDLTDENLDEKFVTLQDSIIEGAVRMRPTLLSGLLDAVRTNFNHQRRDLRLFELGKVFAASASEDGLPLERELFALALTGNETFQNKAMTVREFDFYDAKGALEAAFDALHLPPVEFAAGDVKHLRKGQSAEIRLNGEAVGAMGRLADEIADAYKFRQPVYVAEVDLQTLLDAGQAKVAYHPLPVYPSVVRDVSLLVKRNTSFGEIKRAIENQGFELLRGVEFVDVYEGMGIADDERSLTVRLEYRSDERTLTETDAEEVHNRILQILDEQFGARQRF